jgi:hypothetical protein
MRTALEHPNVTKGYSLERRLPMPDDKTKVGEPDRSRVAADQDYEVGYLAGKYGLSAEQVRQLIARVGNDREKLDQAARQLKRG